MSTPLFLSPLLFVSVPRVERRFYQNPQRYVNTIFGFFLKKFKRPRIFKIFLGSKILAGNSRRTRIPGCKEVSACLAPKAPCHLFTSPRRMLKDSLSQGRRRGFSNTGGEAGGYGAKPTSCHVERSETSLIILRPALRPAASIEEAETIRDSSLRSE
jgi:hypothetical protein